MQRDRGSARGSCTRSDAVETGLPIRVEEVEEVRDGVSTRVEAVDEREDVREGRVCVGEGGARELGR